MARIRFIHTLLIFLFVFQLGMAQGAKKKKVKINADVRLRLEQDWDSQKSDGSYRDDRTRVRFRIRAGMDYTPNNWATFGIRFRTGYPEKQQDPHLTIGDGYHEFSSVPIGMDKLYAGVDRSWYRGWLGRNTFPFEKQNELFWSDNVYLDGFFSKGVWNPEATWIDSIHFGGGIFTMLMSNGTFGSSSLINIWQIKTEHVDQRIRVYPTFYYFKDMPDIPDGNENFRFDYSIAHLGFKAKIIDFPSIEFGLDLYQNLQDYSDNEYMEPELKNQKKGAVVGLLFGDLKEKGHFAFGAYYTYLERYSAVDFMAQNDWVRWDYSNQGSRDGRLTNYKGLELMAGYQMHKRWRLKMRFFTVEQLVKYGTHLENGNRIRLDLEFKL